MSVITTNKIISLSMITSSPTSVSYKDYQGVIYAPTYYTMYDAGGQVTTIPSNCVSSSVIFDLPYDSLCSEFIHFGTKSNTPTGYLNFIAAPNTPAADNFFMNYDLTFLNSEIDFKLINKFFVKSVGGNPRQLKMYIKNHTAGALDGYQITFSVQETRIV
jgi:hypothetical protein